MNSTIHVSVLLKCNLKKVYSFDVGSLGDVPVISDIVCFNDDRGEVLGSVIQRVVDYASSHVFLIIQSMPEKWLGRYASLVERYCSRTFEKAFAASERFLADVPDASVLMRISIMTSTILKATVSCASFLPVILPLLKRKSTNR